MKRLIQALLVTCIVLTAHAVIAFPFLNSWHTPAATPSGTGTQQRAGAGGIYGTGSSRDFGITCAHCHINAPGQIGVTVTPNPAWINKGGSSAYQPGQKYDITVTMTPGPSGDLQKGTSNLNGFAATVEDQQGNPAGSFTTDTTPTITSASCTATAPGTNPMTGTTYLYGTAGACYNIVYIPRSGAVQTWKFSWTAPAAGKGQVTLFYGVVDGDQDGGSSLGDDVKMGTVKLFEGP